MPMTFTQKEIDVLKHIYQNNDFYLKLAKDSYVDINRIDFNSDWERLPIVTKKMLLENKECMITREYISMLYTGTLAKTYTSGSTGDFLEVYWRKEDYNQSLFPLWLYRLKEYGIKPDDRLCYFYTTRTPGRKECWYEYSGNRLGFCKADLSEDRLKRIYEKIYEFSPKWLLLQPSMAMLLCRIKKKFRLKDLKELIYIELTGEVLTESMRKEIKECFSCKIANQYGSNEVNSIAYECKKGHLHIMEKNVYVEILDDNDKPVFGKEGEICVTSLSNRAMPMIRYKIGDRGILYEKRISCHMPGRVLMLTKARSNDWIITKNGEKVSPYALLKVIENINMQTDCAICQFRFLQKTKERILVKLVLDEEISLEEVKVLFYQNLVQKNLREIMYKFELESYMPVSQKTGKIAWFESEVS